VTGRSPWLLCREPRPQAAMRLYCLPHSGGSAGEFLLWSDGLPDHEVWGLQPPGRGSRMADDPFTTMTELVKSLADEVEFAEPYALFGHSLGAAVAWELTLELRARGRRLPERLYLSAHEAPHLAEPDASLPDLDDEALLAEVEQRYDPVPQELREDPEWFAMLLEGLRADLRVVASYRPAAAEPLAVPIVAMGGTEDPVVPQDALAAWHAYTTESFRLRMYPGQHFYFREQEHDVHHHIAADVARPAR
jgi:surfactin synthase thioesterase subunit